MRCCDWGECITEANEKCNIAFGLSNADNWLTRCEGKGVICQLLWGIKNKSDCWDFCRENAFRISIPASMHAPASRHLKR